MTTVYKEGDRVTSKNNMGRYYKVTGVVLVQRLTIQDENTGATFVDLAPDMFDPAPKKLTPVEAWSEVPVLIIRLMQDYGLPLWEYDKRGIRHECYKLLGGAGVKVNEEVKTRVRYLIEQTEGLVQKLRGEEVA